MYALKSQSIMIRNFPVRHFSKSTSTYSILDYFKFYNKKQASAPKEKDTTEVIKEIENKETEIDTKMEVEIIGRRNPRYADKEVILKNLNGFQIHSWIPQENNRYKKRTAASPESDYKVIVSEMLEELFTFNKITKDSNINDLHLRFELLKQVQIKFSAVVPDSEISTLDNYAKIEDFLFKKLDPSLKNSKRTELVPEAIDLNPEDFEGTNISVGEYVFEKQKSKIYKKLLKKANKMEKISFEKFNEQKRTEPTTV